MSDEHNPFYSSVYGHPHAHTPNMDKLREKGTWFQHAYCNSPVCMASRSAFMAGKPVHQLGTYNNCNVIKQHHQTYAHHLSEQGIHTVHIGKTDVWAPSTELGFSQMLLPIDRRPPGDVNFKRRPLSIRNGGRETGYGPHPQPFAHDESVLTEAVRWLKNEAPKLHMPWILTVNILAPHFPQYVTKALWDQFEASGDLPQYGDDSEPAKHPYAQDLYHHFQNHLITEAHTRGLRRGYAGCVCFADQAIGILMDTLEASSFCEDTLFIYTSDHGEMLGKFGLWWKCSLLEDSVRVPLLISGPGFTPNQRVDTPVSLFDVQATLFHAVGGHRPADWWGDPLQSVHSNDATRVVFSEYHGHGVRSGAYMIRQGDWKLIYNMEAPHQLYNLREDPDELKNLVLTRSDKAAELEAILRTLCHPENENERAHQFEDRQLAMIQNNA
jgi:choline-sulfatase